MSAQQIDDYRPVRHRHAVDRATTAAVDVDQVLADGGRRVHHALARLAEWADTGVRSAGFEGTGSGSGTPMWCEAHGRDLHRCQHDGLLCDGIPYRPGTDPAGERGASDRRDPHLVDADRIVALLEARARLDDQLVRLIRGAEVDQPSRPPRNAGPGADWCPSCYRNDQHHEPVAVRPDGRPKYPGGLCSWCGGFKAVERALPPVALLRARHGGQRITQTMVKEALVHERSAKKNRR